MQVNGSINYYSAYLILIHLCALRVLSASVRYFQIISKYFLIRVQ